MIYADFLRIEVRMDVLDSVFNLYKFHCIYLITLSLWRHQMETYSALLAICAGNSPVPGKLPTQRPVTQSFDVFFDLLLNKQLSKQPWGSWFETLSCPLWRQRNVTHGISFTDICKTSIGLSAWITSI